MGRMTQIEKQSADPRKATIRSKDGTRIAMITKEVFTPTTNKVSYC